MGGVVVGASVDDAASAGAAEEDSLAAVGASDGASDGGSAQADVLASEESAPGASPA
jgi:hypothetical protein